MTSSIGRNRAGVSGLTGVSAPGASAAEAPGPTNSDTLMNRGRTGGTLTRAKCSAPERGCRSTTPRLRESPDTYGKGWAGSTARGVRTGNTRSLKSSETPPSSDSVRSSRPTT